MVVEYKETFFDDLNDINEYIIENFSDYLANQVVREIMQFCEALVLQPNLGRIYLRDPYFRWAIVRKKNVLFYHKDDVNGIITVHRIFDSRRDYAEAILSLK
ncbi:MAG: type II toxin-antitoxin system RelE/ParE family toxin [Lachnospiraceae bacterium]|jgi:plasmid stabilization system protein ParE|nr:type II toxin-antitoxin system RelE/ParE family toxin [Lachnospiraceae bacterium]